MTSVIQSPNPAAPVSATSTAVVQTPAVSRHQQQRAFSVTAMPNGLQSIQQDQKKKDLPWWQYYYQLYHYHPPPGRKPTVFGPYLLLQTLGEGEFGKVKLGIHIETGHEVAIKLMRKDHIDSTSRMTKVEREIAVLRTVRHPYIVKLYDVIETEKYIGIILQCASGGELFEYILAHRFLKEKDASRLFAELISGVHYMHQKHIVHRDLKLENLLLDKNRSIVITDFGFANLFASARDDLMSTSCGSPCYAAPELVISEGLYVGSAVDIWSCGVILYAMLCGYLPFDDDPANPEGDNINLLYKYILNTPLAFPDYVSDDARDLLRKMLVPDPSKRCTMKTIMSHRWLSDHQALFLKSLPELEMEVKAADLPVHMAISDLPQPNPDVDATRPKLNTEESTTTEPTEDAVVPTSTPEENMKQEEDEQQPMEVDAVEGEADKRPDGEDAATEMDIRTPGSTQLKGTMTTTDPAIPKISSLELPASMHISETTEKLVEEDAEMTEEEISVVPELPQPTPTPSKTNKKGYPTDKILQFLSGHHNASAAPRNTKPTQRPSSRPTSMNVDHSYSGSILQAKFLSSMQRHVSISRRHEEAPHGASMSTPYVKAATSNTHHRPARPPSEVHPAVSQPIRGTRRKALSLLVPSMSDYMCSDENKRYSGQHNRKTMSFARKTGGRERTPSVSQQQRAPTAKDTSCSTPAWNSVQVMPSVSEHTIAGSHRLSDKEKHRSAGKKLMDWFKKTPLSTRDRTPNLSSRGDMLNSNRPMSTLTPVRAMPIGKPLGSYAIDFNDSKLRTHHGAVDQDALTSRPPNEVFMEVKQALLSMGIDVKRDGEYKLKCTRRKRTLPTSRSTLSVASRNMDRSTDSKRSKMNGTPFRMLLRRTGDIPPPTAATNDDPKTVYGDPVVDPGEEVRFSVELCKIKNLPGLYIVDIRRMRGNVWAYKFLYHTLLDTLNLSGKGGYIAANAATKRPGKKDKSSTSSQHRISCASSGGSSSLIGDVVVEEDHA
ncbi:hypothetical protein DFQ28_011112 [Apophysomyces sp. BC1034]|nr:hypothetical protein DFQ30_007385 [Apophysomyces sp. BC1015]KAG0182742.1 hypothetical protein DFQ29_002377 [Apophysomyces sp. BC1021]KAG0191720.1 hypothetical protein DFQ28_011112 [Apophysomyces sp. BC1034]